MFLFAFGFNKKSSHFTEDLHALPLEISVFTLATGDSFVPFMPFVHCIITCWMMFGWNLRLTLNQHQLKEWLNDFLLVKLSHRSLVSVLEMVR